MVEAARCGYVVVLCYIGLSGPDQSAERVAMRVSQGGHDVPDNKLRSRFSRTIANLQAAIARLPHVLIYDNSDLNVPYRQVAAFDGATAMKPWKSNRARKDVAAIDLLQWGHGDEAVEEVLAVGLPAARLQLQWGHGDEAVEEQPANRRSIA